MGKDQFQFREFKIVQGRSPAKVGTDGILLGAWTDVHVAKRILDIGTGTGLLALMLAQRAPNATIEAVDIHSGALEDARRNFASSSSPGRLRLIEADFFDKDVQYDSLFDLIISNPPFFSNDFPSIDPDRNIWRSGHEFDLSQMLEKTSMLIRKNGSLSLILPCSVGEKLIPVAENWGWYLKRICRVFPKRANPARRLLIEFSRKKNTPVETELVIQAGGANEYTKDYIELTRDFYPWMK